MCNLYSITTTNQPSGDHRSIPQREPLRRQSRPLPGVFPDILRQSFATGPKVRVANWP
jgi:hypothetical protein